MPAIPFDPAPVTLPPVATPGMISSEEEVLYYQLAKEYWGPDRPHLEVGTWLGRSTTRICQGLESQAPGEWHLRCYDRFEWIAAHEPRAQRDGWPEPVQALKPGDSFKNAFLQLLGGFADRVTAYKGEIRDMTTVMHGSFSKDTQLGVLFVDASKGWENVHILLFAARHMTPTGVATRVLFQDFFMWSAYRMHFLLLSIPALEPEIFVEIGSSMVFKTVAVLDEDELRARAQKTTLKRHEIYSAWDRLITAVPEYRLLKQGMHLSLPQMLWHCGFYEDAIGEAKRAPISQDYKAKIANRIGNNPGAVIPPIRERILSSS